MHGHAARAGLPLRPRSVPAQAGQFLPALAAVGGVEQSRIFHARINRVGIGKRRLQVPDALELPRMLRAVIPLMRGQRLARLVRGVIQRSCSGALLGNRRPSGSPGFSPGWCQVFPPSSSAA